MRTSLLFVVVFIVIGWLFSYQYPIREPWVYECWNLATRRFNMSISNADEKKIRTNEIGSRMMDGRMDGWMEGRKDDINLVVVARYSLDSYSGRSFEF